MSQARWSKRDRERTRKEKAVAKADRRVARRELAGTQAVTSQAEQEELLAQLAAIHARYEAKQITFDVFLAERESLVERLSQP